MKDRSVFNLDRPRPFFSVISNPIPISSWPLHYLYFSNVITAKQSRRIVFRRNDGTRLDYSRLALIETAVYTCIYSRSMRPNIDRLNES